MSSDCTRLSGRPRCCRASAGIGDRRASDRCADRSGRGRHPCPPTPCRRGIRSARARAAAGPCGASSGGSAMRVTSRLAAVRRSRPRAVPISVSPLRRWTMLKTALSESEFACVGEWRRRRSSPVRAVEDRDAGIARGDPQPAEPVARHACVRAAGRPRRATVPVRSSLPVSALRNTTPPPSVRDPQAVFARDQRGDPAVRQRFARRRDRGAAGGIHSRRSD